MNEFIAAERYLYLIKIDLGQKIESLTQLHPLAEQSLWITPSASHTLTPE